jgi:hypothetical protein
MFNYYTLNDSEQIRFFQLPKELVKHERFKGLSDSAKILYSLLRDRISLSAKNGWIDELGRVYIIFTLSEIMEDLGCANQKATKSMIELQKIGLIESIRRGQGKPNVIYVKNFATGLNDTIEYAERPVNPLNHENHESRIMKIMNQESWKSHLLNHENHDQSILTLNDLDLNDTESSQSQRQSHVQRQNSAAKLKTDMTLTMTPDVTERENIKSKNKRASATAAETPKYNITDHNAYEQLIKENIEYQHYAMYDKSDLEMIDGLVQIMLDVILTQDPSTVKIGKETKSRDIVKSVYLKLNSQHIDHIIEQYKAQRHKITHKTAYLRTMLYTVGQEIDAHYTNQVRADGVVW